MQPQQGWAGGYHPPQPRVAGYVPQPPPVAYRRRRKKKRRTKTTSRKRNPEGKSISAFSPAFWGSRGAAASALLALLGPSPVAANPLVLGPGPLGVLRLTRAPSLTATILVLSVPCQRSRLPSLASTILPG
ncbi:hypothetical protein B0T24DRAFT_671412, partial [Lasiosphaeria ovina]